MAHSLVAHDDAHEELMDDIVFKSCMVQSQSVPCNFTFVPASTSATDEDVVTSRRVESTYTSYVPRDPSKPALQPGAGIYTSPLTVNLPAAATLEDVMRAIEDVQRALRMPAGLDKDRFKYGVAVYFTSGYARFSIRIWRRGSSSDSYAVEVMRERGDRILVTRFFELLSGALCCCHDVEACAAVVSAYVRAFTVDMFDWAPHRLPPAVLEALPEPSAEAVASGIAAMVSMAGSPYDDVAVNGCASVAKLVAASDRTRRNMASSAALVQTLLHVVCTDGDATITAPSMSIDTRSNAALALAELMQDDLKVGAGHLLNAMVAFPSALPALALLCSSGPRGASAVPAYMCLCLRTDCVRVLTAAVCASKDTVTHDHDDVRGLVLPQARIVLSGMSSGGGSTDGYSPLTAALESLAASVSEGVCTLSSEM